MNHFKNFWKATDAQRVLFDKIDQLNADLKDCDNRLINAATPDEKNEIKREVAAYHVELQAAQKLLEELNKSVTVQKPGPSIHTSKWDDCVEQVKAQGKGVNAYAVCTAQLGAESFKSQKDAFKYQLTKSCGHCEKAVDTGFAGPTPNSLLAEQDLEGKKKAAVLCPECGGMGNVAGTPCAECHGSGHIEKGITKCMCMSGGTCTCGDNCTCGMEKSIKKAFNVNEGTLVPAHEVKIGDILTTHGKVSKVTAIHHDGATKAVFIQLDDDKTHDFGYNDKLEVKR